MFAAAGGCSTGLGAVGYLVNGVGIFDATDGTSYENQDVWHNNAVSFEYYDLDVCLGHAAPNGQYHRKYTCFIVQSLLDRVQRIVR